MKKLRILSIGHSYVVSSNRHIMDSINQDSDFEVTIICPESFEGSLRTIQKEEDEQQSLKVLPLKAHLTSRIHFFFYRGLSKIIKEGSYDLIHIWEEPYVIAGAQIAYFAKKAKIPFFFRSAQSINKKYPPPFNFFEKFVLKHTSGWNAGAGLVYKNLIKRGYPKKNSAIITLGVSKKMFTPLTLSEKQNIREKEGLKGTVFCFLGRLVKDKGLDHIMKAFENVNQNSSLLILGDGPYKDLLQNWVNEKELKDRVIIKLVKHDEVPKLLASADVLLAPSQTMPNWREQFGRMIVEAFATKVAVIGSDSGEIPFVISDAGIVVREESTEDLKNAMNTLIEDPVLRERLSDKGHQRFLEHYEVGSIAKKYQQFYKSLLTQ